MNTLPEQDGVPSSRSYLYRPSWRPYNRIEFSQEERQKILQIHAKRRITVAEAARLLNKPWESTRRLFKELGISPSNRKLIKVGMRFGKVVVIDNTKTLVVGIKRNTEISACLVLCDCGTEKIIANLHLRRGAIKSCGPCGRTERMPDSDWRAIWASVRGRARSKNNEMTLTPLHIKAIGLLPCGYCSHPPQNCFYRITFVKNRRTKDAKPTFLYSGIDRVDPSKGYIPGNVVPCCKFCNYAKMNRSLDEFLEQIARYGSTVTRELIFNLAHRLTL